MKVLQKMDIFGTPITLRIFGNEKYHNIISVSLSLITYISTIIFTYFFGLDFIFHLESQILQSTRTSKGYQFYNLSMNDFFFAWKIEDDESREINMTDIFFPIIGYYSYKTDEIESIKYDKCENYNISIPNEIKDYYCIDMKNYSLGGSMENENKVEYFFLNIGMYGMDINTKSDYHNLIGKYGTIYLVIYYPTISFVPEEEKPYEISYTRKYIILDSKLVNINEFYIQKYIFEDDEGWVIPKIKINKAFGISDIETSNYLDNINDDEVISYSHLYTGNFYIDRKYSYYKRSFTKTFQSLSISYAFFLTIYIICNFIVSFCNKFLLLETIMMNGNYFNSNSTNNYDIHHIINDFGDRMESSNMNLRILNNNKISLNNINKENNNITSLNNIYKENNMIIRNLNLNSRNENKNKVNYIREENSVINKNSFKKSINYNNKTSVYKLLFFHIFHFILPEKGKVEYQINSMNRKTFLKKLDIHNYLNHLKKVEMLYIQTQKRKIKKKNMITNSIN